ncbi:unnamed protein product [Sphagnum jensenii]|uniref:Uncharacterized protein n=1 Tax=Sphagnum jensenii TaxID=128206 RepID=A0ABP0X8I5_9BRYO
MFTRPGPSHPRSARSRRKRSGSEGGRDGQKRQGATACWCRRQIASPQERQRSVTAGGEMPFHSMPG